MTHFPRQRSKRISVHGRERPFRECAKLVIRAETKRGHTVTIRVIRGLDKTSVEFKIFAALAVFTELVGDRIVIRLGIEIADGGHYRCFIGSIDPEHFLADITWSGIRDRLLEITKIGGTD